MIWGHSELSIIYVDIHYLSKRQDKGFGGIVGFIKFLFNYSNLL